MNSGLRFAGMKSLFRAALLLACLAAPREGAAQGIIDFHTQSVTGPRALWGVGAPPYPPLPTNVDTNVVGIPYFAQLYWAMGIVSDASTLISVTNPIATFSTNLGGGFINAASGGGYRTLPCECMVTVQVRAWSANGGSTYEEAYAAALNGAPWVELGSSQLWSTFAIMDAPPGPLPPRLFGPNFVVFPQNVLEPSTFALGALGLAVLALFRRRRRASYEL